MPQRKIPPPVEINIMDDDDDSKSQSKLNTNGFILSQTGPPPVEDKKRMSSVISIDDQRTEQPWNDSAERLIAQWIQASQDNSLAHNTKGKQFKRMYHLLGIPTAVIPLVLSATNEVFMNYKYVTIGGMILSGSLSAVLQFLNPGKKCSEHLHHEALYGGLANELKVILSKPRRFRTQCDVTLERALNRYNALNAEAPDL